MDHTKIQPINKLPLLMSSLVLTCFNDIELQNSLRVYRYLYFKRLQKITRINSFDLIGNDVIKDEFLKLARGILAFVPNGEDNRIGPNIMCAF